MTAFIDEFRGEFGVEPICRVLAIAPSTYRARKAIERDPSRASDRARRDEGLRERIEKVWSDNRGLYGVVSRMLWKFPGSVLRACEGSVSQAARSRGMGSRG